MQYSPPAIEDEHAFFNSREKELVAPSPAQLLDDNFWQAYYERNGIGRRNAKRACKYTSVDVVPAKKPQVADQWSIGVLTKSYTHTHTHTPHITNIHILSRFARV